MHALSRHKKRMRSIWEKCKTFPISKARLSLLNAWTIKKPLPEGVVLPNALVSNLATPAPFSNQTGSAQSIQIEGLVSHTSSQRYTRTNAYKRRKGYSQADRLLENKFL